MKKIEPIQICAYRFVYRYDMTIKHIYDKLFCVNYVLAYNIKDNKDIDNLNTRLKKIFTFNDNFEYLGENRGYCDKVEADSGLLVVIVLKEFDGSPYCQATLAHECFHATRFTLESKGIKLCDETEEVFAYNIDMLINSFLEEHGKKKSSYFKKKFKLNNNLYGRKITQIIIRQANKARERIRI